MGVGDSGAARPQVGAELSDVLARWAGDDIARRGVAATVEAITAAGVAISQLIGRGPLAGALGAETGVAHADGDVQKALDAETNRLVIEALAASPTAYYASEEEDDILTLTAGAPLAVAVDPLDGSSNIDVNVSVGTIFSILPASREGATASFLRPSSEQVAAGYVLYGPHTSLLLTLGDGVDLYVLDPDSKRFRCAATSLRIPVSTKEFAINMSNYRHWTAPVRSFIDDCIEGVDGPRGKDFNMRWVASMVADAHRIFSRGGIYLYPGDRRPGYERGRLRQIYEAAPIAMLVEQAGGGATDGFTRILEKSPSTLHERTPLIFGSARKVDLVRQYHVDPAFARDAAPLFQQRGLFKS
jgi:fructose-1,6-bisphosphatase I